MLKRKRNVDSHSPRPQFNNGHLAEHLCFLIVHYCSFKCSCLLTEILHHASYISVRLLYVYSV
jgi:hypothetical protein